MNLLIKKESQSEQVAAIIEQKIIAGEFKPKSRIKSSRMLAEKFSTSRQVIRSAMDMLEKKKLITRSHQKGYFVSENIYSPKQKEIYILGFGCSLENKYFKDIASISLPPNLRPGYSFLTRSVGLDVKLPYEIFDLEMIKIENLFGLDCVLINAVNMNAKMAKRCNSIQVPVIFYGDFGESLKKPVKLNQIKASNKGIAKKCADFLLDKGICEVTLLAGYLSNDFMKEFYLELIKYFPGADCLELPPDNHFDSEEKQMAEFAKLLSGKLKNKGRKHAFLANGVADHLIPGAFEMNGRKLGKDVKVFSASNNIGCLPCLKYDYTPFFNGVYKRIDELTENSRSECKIQEIELGLSVVNNGAI